MNRQCPKCGKGAFNYDAGRKIWVCLYPKCSHWEGIFPALKCSECQSENWTYDASDCRWKCACGIRTNPVQLPCKQCHAETYRQWCLNPKCPSYCRGPEAGLDAVDGPKNIKPKIVIEIKAGALSGVYCDQDLDIVLVDYDEIEGGSSAVVIPDKTTEIPDDTRRLAIDAEERSR